MVATILKRLCFLKYKHRIVKLLSKGGVYEKISLFNFNWMMVFGMNAFCINAHEEPTELFNFKTGEYELVQPRAVVCYCGTVMDTYSVEKVYDSYGQPCDMGILAMKLSLKSFIVLLKADVQIVVIGK